MIKNKWMYGDITETNQLIRKHSTFFSSSSYNKLVKVYERFVLHVTSK